MKREPRQTLPGLRGPSNPREAGFGDGLAAAFELVMTPALFGLLGYWIDRWLGIVPVLTLVLSISVLVYELWKVWGRYVAESDIELERWRAARAEVRRSNG